SIINRLGFNNEGQAAALGRLSGRRSGVVGVNIGAGRDSEDRIGDYALGISRMSAVADYLTINISSPNTPGFRDLPAPQPPTAEPAGLARSAGAGGARCVARARAGGEGRWCEAAAASRQARPRYRRCRPS